MTLAARFCADPAALLTDSLYAGHQMTVCMDDSGEVRFADASVASSLNAGPWLPLDLDGYGLIPAEVDVDAAALAYRVHRSLEHLAADLGVELDDGRTKAERDGMDERTLYFGPEGDR
jgi:hypothetical protein